MKTLILILVLISTSCYVQTKELIFSCKIYKDSSLEFKINDNINYDDNFYARGTRTDFEWQRQELTWVKKFDLDNKEVIIEYYDPIVYLELEYNRLYLKYPPSCPDKLIKSFFYNNKNENQLKANCSCLSYK